jgi:hypothetical protein
VRHFKILSVACLPLALSIASCSGGDDKPATTTGGGCTTFDYSKWTASTTSLTLATDIMPIFTANCSLATACHSKGTATPPVLGDVPGMNTVTADQVKAAIVDVTSGEVPSMKFVDPTNPQNSYLMRKVENTNPGCGLMCTSTPASGCATQMPNGGTPLATADQDKIRSWIKQGAM